MQVFLTSDLNLFSDPETDVDEDGSLVKARKADENHNADATNGAEDDADHLVDGDCIHLVGDVLAGCRG